MRYKCDTCGTPIYADPQEERICATCELLREERLRRIRYAKYTAKSNKVEAVS